MGKYVLKGLDWKRVDLWHYRNLALKFTAHQSVNTAQLWWKIDPNNEQWLDLIAYLEKNNCFIVEKCKSSFEKFCTDR